MSIYSDKTIDYYDQNAHSFVAGTVDASMHETLDVFAELLPTGGTVLDWGCGSGRDSKALRNKGFSVTSTDASSTMCDEALLATGTTVRHERFDELDEVDCYDGIWACASLLHVSPEELPAILERAAKALKPHGILYCSFKHGKNTTVDAGRWFTRMDEPALTQLLAPHFDIVRIWTTADVRKGRDDQTWLNCLVKKRS